MKHLLMAVSAISLLGVAACAPSDKPELTETETPETGSTETAANEVPEIGTFGIDLQYVDESRRPGDDFNKYVNGKWLDTFEIPADKSRFGVFDKLAENAETQERRPGCPQDPAQRGRIYAFCI